MIEFRYPLILFFYAPALIIWLYWIINSRNKMLLSNVDKTLRERLLIKIELAISEDLSVLKSLNIL